jgi:hypothetical protein
MNRCAAVSLARYASLVQANRAAHRQLVNVDVTHSTRVSKLISKEGMLADFEATVI